MEPNLVPYSPILHRPPLRWPNGARVALWVVPNIEHYEYLPKFVRTRDPWPRSPHPDILGYTQRDYGNRVGLWRLFEVTDALNIRCTVSLNMAVLQHFPGDPRRDGGPRLGVHVARHLQHALSLELLARRGTRRDGGEQGHPPAPHRSSAARLVQSGDHQHARHVRSGSGMRLRLHGRPVSRRPAVPAEREDGKADLDALLGGHQRRDPASPRAGG